MHLKRYAKDIETEYKKVKFIVMNKIELSDEQLQLVSKALEFYARIGIGQFKEVLNHPTFDSAVERQCKEGEEIDYGKYHRIREEASVDLASSLRKLTNSNFGINSCYGIRSEKVDESCREAFYIYEEIRHEFWKRQPEDKRKQYTVNAYPPTFKGSNIIKIEKS